MCIIVLISMPMLSTVSVEPRLTTSVCSYIFNGGVLAQCLDLTYHAEAWHSIQYWREKRR